MINLDTPRKHRTLVAQAHQVALNMLRPISRKYDRAEHEYPKELDLLAAMIDGLSKSGGSTGAGASGVGREEEDDDVHQERDQPRLGPLDRGDVLGRHGAVAEPASPRSWQLGHRLGRQRRTARAAGRHVGGDGDHRTRHGLGLGQPRYDRNAGRRRVRPERREDLRHLGCAGRQRGRLGNPGQEARPGRDQVIRGREGHARDEGRAPRAQARDPRLRDRRDQLRRLPGAG